MEMGWDGDEMGREEWYILRESPPYPKNKGLKEEWMEMREGKEGHTFVIPFPPALNKNQLSRKEKGKWGGKMGMDAILCGELGLLSGTRQRGTWRMITPQQNSALSL
jgi:hypothetical protein